jgi:hypothetical protein
MTLDVLDIVKVVGLTLSGTAGLTFAFWPFLSDLGPKLAGLIRPPEGA